jgi:hypothetical protein
MRHAVRCSRFTICLSIALAAAPAFAALPTDAPRSGAELADAGARGTVALTNLRWPAPGATLEAQARSFLAAHAGTWALSAEDLAGLEFHTVRRSKSIDVVRFRQTVAGVPVLDGDVAVTLNRRGEVIFVASALRPVVESVAAEPGVDAPAARRTALAAARLAGEPSWEAIDLVVFPGADRARLAWRVRLQAPGSAEWRAIVDAATGEIVRLEDVTLYDDAAGQAFLPNPLASAGASYNDPGFVDGGDADTPQLTGELAAVTLRDVTFGGADYSLLGPYASCLDWDAPAGTCPIEATADFGYGSRSDDRFEAVNVYLHIDEFLRYVNEELGLPVLPFQYVGGVRYDPRGFNGADNSSYSSGTGRLRFGEGGVDDAEDSDVVIHELGHGIHDWVTNGGLSQVQGLSEGLGDYFAVSWMRSFGLWAPSDPEYNWVFGWDGHNPFWPGRVTNWTDTRHYPEDLVGQVHTDGQFWSSANADVWDAIGREATDEAVIEGISMTTGSSSQAVAAQAVIQAAAELGYGPAVLAQIETIYDAVGYNVTAPTDILFFDDFERGNTSRWSAAFE